MPAPASQASWMPIVILASAQFVMVLDSSVMNVSISQIVADLDGQEGGATGSGFYLDKQGHVVTNNHVVQDAAEKNGNIEVIDHEGDRYKATVVGRTVKGVAYKATVTERAFFSLEAPVLRVAGFDTPFPPAKVEKLFLPDVDRVLEAVDRSLAY